MPHPDDPRLDEARVAAVLESSVGTVYLFSSPNAGGLCASTWIEGDRGYQGRLNVPSVCGRAAESFFAFGSHEFRSKVIRLFWGRAGAGVARVSLRFGDKTIDVPLTGRYFLAEFRGPANQLPGTFPSYRADGKLLEQHSFLGPSRAAGRAPPPPHPVTRPHEVAAIDARGGAEHVTLLVARASDGSDCVIVRSDRTPTNSGCWVTPPKPREIGVSAMRRRPRRDPAARRPRRLADHDARAPLRRRPPRDGSTSRGLGALRSRTRRLHRGATPTDACRARFWPDARSHRGACRGRDGARGPQPSAPLKKPSAR